MKTLADRVRLLVDVAQRGNVNTAAKDTGVSQPSLNRIVNGTTLNPSDTIIEKIGLFYGVTPKWLRTGKGPPAWIETGMAGLDSPLASGPPPAELRRWSLAVTSLRLPSDIEGELLQLPFSMVKATKTLVPFAHQSEAGFHEAVRYSLIAWLTWLETFLKVSGTGGVSTALSKGATRYVLQLGAAPIPIHLYERRAVDTEMMDLLVQAYLHGATVPLMVHDSKHQEETKRKKSRR